MAKLREITQGNELNNLVLEGLEQSCPLLNVMEFYDRPDDSDYVKKDRDGETKSKITRSLNEDNTATPPTPTYEQPVKKIISFDAKVDRILEDRNRDIMKELYYQLKKESIEAGYVLQEMFLSGDSATDAEDFDGLENLVVLAQQDPIAANGLQMPVGGDSALGDQQAAIEALLAHALNVRGGASHMIVPNRLQIRLLTVARRLGYYSQSHDELGNLIEKINDIQVVKAGYDKAGNELLPFDKTVGTSNDCSSIFFVRLGERVDLSYLTSVGVSAVYAGQIGNQTICNVNIDIAPLVQADTAIFESQGYRL